MSYRVPDPIFGDTFKIIAVFGGLVLLIVTIVFFRFWAPCSWYAGTNITEVPLRCLPVDR